jgi:diphthine-ammonia ligase
MNAMADSLKIPGVKHKVIGLVSGGKDSCFNLMHCLANGHEIVAIATLIPEPGIGELVGKHSRQALG